MEVEFGHSLEDMVSMLCVCCGVRGGDEKVIHVDEEPSFCDHVLKGVVHESLECGRGVAKAEEHDGGFEESFVGNEGCFPLVAILDADVVISPMNIEFGEVMSIFQLIHKVGNEGKRVSVAGSVFIEVLVILAGVEFTVFLLDKEEGGCLRRVGRTDLYSS